MMIRIRRLQPHTRCVAAAVIAGAAIAAGGTMAAGSMAAGATTAAANTAAGEQQWALQQQEQQEAPYTSLGTAALPQYESLLGLGNGGAAGELSALQATPGYQFTQQQGETGILNAASAEGGVSGNTLAALDAYNTGLASQTYQQQLQDTQNAVGIGQAAAAGQAANIGSVASNLSNIALGQGTNEANIEASTIAGLSNVASSGINNYATLSALGALNNQVPGYPVSGTSGIGSDMAAAGTGVP